MHNHRMTVITDEFGSDLVKAPTNHDPLWDMREMGRTPRKGPPRVQFFTPAVEHTTGMLMYAK
jgi:hypothetical protein